MALKLNIHVGDTVEVIAGADKGKKGAVIIIMNSPKKPIKIKVQGVKMMTHFDKEAGRHTAEGLIDYSNVKLIEKKKAKPAKKAKSK